MTSLPKDTTPWYQRRAVTGCLGALGVFLALIGSCTVTAELDRRRYYQGETIYQSYQQTNAVFSPDGKRLFGEVYSDLPTAAKTGELRAWDSSSGRLLWRARLPRSGQSYTCLGALAASRKHVALVSDETLEVRNAETGKRLWKASVSPTTHWKSLCFSVSGEWVHVAFGARVLTYRVTDGECIGSVKVINGAEEFTPYPLADGNVLLPDVKRKNSAETITRLVVCSPTTGKVLRRLSANAYRWGVSPDGTQVLIWEGSTLRVVDLRGRERARSRFTQYEHSAARFTFLPGNTGVRIAALHSYYQDKTDTLWHFRTGELVPATSDSHEWVLSPTGARALQIEIQGQEDRILPLGYLCETASGRLYANLEGTTGWRTERERP